MRRRVTLVGLAYGRLQGAPEGGALGAGVAGCAGDRLAALAGVADVRAVAATRNLLQGVRGPRVGRRELRRAAARAPLRGRTVLLGRDVAWAYRADHLPPYLWERRGRAWVSVMPHPSGRNRLWNDPRQLFRARVFLQRTLGLDAVGNQGAQAGTLDRADRAEGHP
jgi:hypothetical protein